MFAAYLKALTLIFLAEMGDKTQLMAMTFATKYKVKDILLGIAIGAFFNHGLAILLGSFLQKVISFEIIYLVAGVVFIIFGLLSLKVEDEEVEETATKFGPIVTVSIAFFIGELGDKTQLTALALSTSQGYPALILLGTVSGMVLTGLLGIWVGIKLGSKIPEMQLKIGAATIFMVFGIEKLLASSYFNQYVLIFMGVIALSTIVFAYKTRRFILDFKVSSSAYATAAERLHQHFEILKKGVDELCLGSDVCDGCDGSTCLVGSLKVLIQTGIDHDYDEASIKRFKVEDQLIKKFSKQHVEELLEYIENDILKDEELKKNPFVVEVKRLLEKAKEAL